MTSPKAWWLVALLLLGPWHLVHLYHRGDWTRPPLPHGDGPDYECLAYSISRGDGFHFAWQSHEWQSPYLDDGATYTQLQRRELPGPTASRPPLYPTLIAAIYRMVPRGPMAFAVVRVLSSLLTAIAGATAVAIAFDIASRFATRSWMPSFAALCTLSLALLDRTIRIYSTDFLTEPLAMLLTTCLVWTGLQLTTLGRGLGWLCCLAFLTGLLVLTRSMTVFWLPGLTILVAFSVPKHRIRYASMFLIIALMILAPWWIRNCIVLESWMPLGGQGAASLRGGYCDEALADQGNWHGNAETRIQKELDSLAIENEWTQAQREVALAGRANQETFAWIQAHRGDVPRLVGLRVWTHWGPYWGSSLIWRIAMVIGAIALCISRRPESIWLLGLPLISTASIAFLYETGGRFLVPLYAVLYLLAGLGVAWFAQQFVDRLVRSKGL